MDINVEYTSLDHEFRDEDEYAQAKYDITTRWLKKFSKPNDVLYNIGCGAGHFNLQASTKLSLKVKGFEPDKEALAQAEKNCIGEKSIELSNSGVFDINDSKSADLIVMHDVLEHIKDDDATAKKIKEILKNNGKAIISVPAGQWLFGLHDENLGHYRRYSKSSLIKVLRPYFNIDKIRYFGFSFIPIVLWFSVIKRKNYPQEQASKGIANSVLKFICKIESYIPLPIGTSIIAQISPKD